MRARRRSFADALHEAYRQLTGVPVERDLRAYADVVRTIDEVEPRRLDAHALRDAARTLRLRARDGEPPDALLVEVFAVAREAAAHVLGLRPFEVQIAAAVAMHRGRLAQLATGEGKTLVAALAALLRALYGRGVHVFTANDYLARRDAEWMGPLYRFFELQPAFVVEGLPRDARRQAYAADVTYVTAKEAGFDFLRDHAALDARERVHRGHDFAVVDEADFILIDEARVPLVIAGDAPSPDVEPATLAQLVRRLTPPWTTRPMNSGARWC